ncbi:DUF3592 domain-containing protein [Acetobacter fallax]|uniref:DUF3592 domain-containing protein n=1 Tax=Acetobacter fallax TaxID=1737473 RepID=A0ABX0KA35_9PROT|nr:DUF3592 domain-containing protein [Acetobacter fallax]NHO31693.1 hypothetical protein [Acetobacter fallax]NHO35252.1 hypothetical protein [Acetobacter fallax]
MLPPELDQPLPRRVYKKEKTDGGLAVAAILGLVFYVPLLLTLIVLMSVSLLKMNRLITSGHNVSAIVDALSVIKTKSGVSHRADYSFALPDGRRFHGTENISVSDFHLLSTGQNLTAVYEPSEPGNTHLAKYIQADRTKLYRLTDMLCFVLIGAPAFVIVCSIIFVRRQRAKETYLLQWGTASRARIIDEKQIRVRFGFRTKLTCAFHDNTGRARTTTCNDLPGLKGLLFPADATHPVNVIRSNPVVLFDPCKPSRSLIYPFSMMTCEKPAGSAKINHPGAPPRTQKSAS